MPAQSPVRGRMALIAASLAGLLLLFVLGTVFSSGPVIEAGGTVPAARVEISEYMTSNGSAYPDGNGLFSDWVELHNTTGSRISLAGWALSDGNTTWLLPARTLEADEYLVIFCDGDGKDPLHANFRLKAAGGETLSLKDASGDVEDTTVTIPLQTNVSAVRTTAGFSESAHSTPGYPNTDEGYAAYRATRVGTSDALFLSEILAQNTLTLPDADGAYPDYIEVVNRSDEPAALKGYGLTNDPDEPLKWQFPERTLAPGETVLVFASDKGHSADPEELHAPFKINRSSDTLYLSTPAGVLIDQVEVNGLAADAALLRDAGGAWSVGEPSPGYPNTEEGIRAHAQRVDTIRQSAVQVSEVMSRNTTVGAIDRSDWVELQNISDAPVSLAGLFLSDDPELPGLFPLPDVTLQPGGRVVFYCNEANLPDARNRQTNFRLNGDGAVYLYDADGRLLDGISYTGLPMNVSRGRMDTEPGLFYFSSPTPGGANTGGLRRLSSAPEAATPAGVYAAGPLEVSLLGEHLYYTLDGTVPTSSSTPYTGPITLDKSASLRAVSLEPGAVPSACSTFSYIIGENHTMDVVSVTSDPDGLFSHDRGILVLGGGSPAYPHNGANFFQDWERYAHVELLPKNGPGGEDPGFSADCGLKVFSGMSRIYEKKSLALNFRDCYGASSLDYPVFDSRDFGEYDNLILRTSGQDRLLTVMKDAMFTSVLDDAGVGFVQAYRPVVMYLNGDYYGVRYIRERLNADYVASHCGVSADTVDLLQGNRTVNAGSDAAYLELLNFVKTHDMADPGNYRYVTERMNVQSYCDYLISEAYCGNQDSGNIRFFRSPDYDGGRFHWIVYDVDLGFQNAAVPYGFYHILNPDGTGAGNSLSTVLVNRLLKNPEFRATFIERMAYLMQNVFTTDNLIAHIDRFEQILKPEIGRDLDKWGGSSGSWSSRVEGLRTFVRGRQATLEKEVRTSSQLRSILALTDEEIAAVFG